MTPEAPTLETALGDVEPERTIDVTLTELVEARDELSTTSDGPIGAVCVGTPHASVEELEELARMVRGLDLRVPVFVNAGRDTVAATREAVEALRAAGVTVVSDTCTYLAPILEAGAGGVMTDSAKWAWYAPANLGVEVVFGSLAECVRSAQLGRVWRDESLWTDG